MPKPIQILYICLFLLNFSLASFSDAATKKEEIDIKFNTRGLSAKLHETPLKLVLERLKEKKGIWFNWDESLQEQKVSIRFEDLPLEVGVKRILHNFNHCLVFDQDKKLVRILILDEKRSIEPQTRKPGVIQTKNIFQSASGFGVSENPFIEITSKSTGVRQNQKKLKSGNPFGGKNASSFENSGGSDPAPGSEILFKGPTYDSPTENSFLFQPE